MVLYGWIESYYSTIVNWCRWKDCHANTFFVAESKCLTEFHTIDMVAYKSQGTCSLIIAFHFTNELEFSGQC